MTVRAECPTCGAMIVGSLRQIEYHVKVCSGITRAIEERRPDSVPDPGITHGEAIERVRCYVRDRGGSFYLLHQSGPLRGSAGIPDTFIMVDDLAFWWEAKTEAAPDLREEQAAFRDRARERGVVVLVGGPSVVIDYVERGGNRGSGD